MEIFLRFIVIIAILAMSSSCTNDVLDSSYATQSEVKASNAIQRGWIPAWLPSEAMNIREVHNIDTNESALSFNLPIGTNWHPPASCKPANAGQFTEPSFAREWLPKDISNYDFFGCPSGQPINGNAPILQAIAIQPGRQHIIHWRVFSR